MLMTRDCLIIKLRAEFNNHIRPIKINSQCEFCGSCDDLHLHHIDTFSNLLDKTLEDLNIDVYSENFTDLEVENINNIMLGKQLRSKLVTLCKNCHKEVHKDGYIKARDRIKPKKTKAISLEFIEALEGYLESCVEQKIEFLTKEDREPLIKKIGLVDEKHSNFKKNKITYVKNIETLNSHLTSLGLDYQIVQLPRGTTRNKKRYNAIWVIEKLY